MNIESALRRRAVVCRVLAALGWLVLLFGAFIYVKTSFPSLIEIAQRNELRDTVGGDFNANLIVIVAPVFIVFAGLSCFLAKFTFSLNSQADKYTSLADALCLSGSSISELERAIKITTHNAASLSMADIATDKDVKALVDLLKEMK